MYDAHETCAIVGKNLSSHVGKTLTHKKVFCPWHQSAFIHFFNPYAVNAPCVWQYTSTPHCTTGSQHPNSK